MKTLLAFFIFSSFILHSQNDFLDISKIVKNTKITTSDTNQSVIKGYFISENKIFSFNKVNSIFSTFKLNISVNDLKFDFWNEKQSKNQYVDLLFNEFKIISNNLFINPTILEILKNEFELSNFILDINTGDFIIISGNEDYDEISLKISHLNYFSYFIDLTVIKKRL